MILDEQIDTSGKKYFRASLIDRYALTLENYASSDLGSRFFTSEFLDGFCERRNEVHAHLGKTSASLALVSTVLAFFQSVKGDISLWGITFSVPEVGSLALCVIVSLNLYVVVCAMIDQLIIDRLMNGLGAYLGMQSFEIFLADRTSLNLWASALTPKYFGLRSGAGHQRAYRVHTAIFLVYGFLLFSFPVAISLYSIYDRLADQPEGLELLLSGVSCFLFFMSIFLIILFSVRYKFLPAELPEPNPPIAPDSPVEMGSPFRGSENGEEI